MSEQQDKISTSSSDSSFFPRSFTFTDGNNATETITISENSVYLPGHGSIIWAGSVVFSFHLLVSRTLQSTLRDKKVLDLGSGCGMTAMAAAMGCNTHIIASDLPSNVEHLQKMINLNNIQEKCSAMALDWCNASHLYDPPQQHPDAANIPPYPPQTFDVIIGCEVVYHEPILIPLLDTLDYHLKASTGLCYLISARHRHCYLQLFYELQRRNYAIVSIDTLAVPEIALDGFAEPEKLLKEIAKITENKEVFQGEALGKISFTPSEELSVGWFSEGEFLYDIDKLILVTIRRC